VAIAGGAGARLRRALSAASVLLIDVLRSLRVEPSR